MADDAQDQQRKIALQENSPFKNVEPTEEQQKLIAQARRAYEIMRLDIKANTKMGRYQSLALTALEESAMWLNKSITHDG